MSSRPAVPGATARPALAPASGVDLTRRVFVASGAMLAAAAVAPFLPPTRLMADERGPRPIGDVLPKAFGDWKLAPATAGFVENAQASQLVDRLYSQVVERTYVGPEDYRIMLVAAYGRDQRGSLQLHYPEVCYPAQGFRIHGLREGGIPLADGELPVRTLETVLDSRYEPVTYWTLIGDYPALGGFQKKLIEARYALHGYVPDGILVRVSSIDRDDTRALERQRGFIQQMLGSLTGSDRLRLRGTNQDPSQAARPL